MYVLWNNAPIRFIQTPCSVLEHSVTMRNTRRIRQLKNRKWLPGTTYCIEYITFRAVQRKSIISKKESRFLRMPSIDGVWFDHLICVANGVIYMAALDCHTSIRPEKANPFYSTIKFPCYYPHTHTHTLRAKALYARVIFTHFRRNDPNWMKSFLSTAAKMKLKCQFSGLEVNVVGIGSAPPTPPKTESRKQAAREMSRRLHVKCSNPSGII